MLNILISLLLNHKILFNSTQKPNLIATATQDLISTRLIIPFSSYDRANIARHSSCTLTAVFDSRSASYYNSRGMSLKMNKLFVNANVASYRNSLYLLPFFTSADSPSFDLTSPINQFLVDFIAESMKIAFRDLLLQAVIFV